MRQSAFTILEFRKLVLMILMIFLVAPIAPAETAAYAFFTTNAPIPAAQTTAQESKSTEVRELKLGPSIERDLSGGEKHIYQATLTVGQYARVIVEQKSVDVLVRILGPDGSQLAEVENDPTEGTEEIFSIAQVSGDYRVEIHPVDSEVRSGTYVIKLLELREATDKDRVQIAAAKIQEAGNRLREQGTAEARRKAISKFEQSLPLWREAGDKRGEAYALTEIGIISSNLGEPKKALEYDEQAMVIWRALGDRFNQATTLTNMGVVHWRAGDSRKALAHHGQALSIARGAHYREREAIVLANTGAAYSALGQLDEALTCLYKALPLFPDRRRRAVTLNNIAGANQQLGEFQKALEYHSQALPLRRAIGDRNGEATTLHNLGEIYGRLAEHQKAIEYLNQSLALSRAIGNRQLEALSLQILSRVNQRLGNLREALDFSNQALALSRAVGDRRLQAYELHDLGKIHLLRGDPKKALDQLDQALSMARAVEDQWAELYILASTADAYSSSGDPKKALEYYAQSLDVSRRVRDQLGEAATLFGIARAQRESGNLPQARSHIELALKTLETSRTKLVGQQLRTSFMASVRGAFEFYIKLLMQMHLEQPSAGFDVVALQASERARARSLLEILVEAGTEIREGVDPALLERERSSQRRLNIQAERLTRLLGGKHTDAQGKDARTEVEALLAEYERVQALIRAKSPRYAALTQPQPLSLKEIQQMLDEGTLLLEYALGEERSYLWAVTPNSVASFELPKRADIEAAATRVYEALTARNKLVRFEKRENKQARVARADDEYFEASSVLSQMLLGPVARHLGRKRLLIVSDGALQYVPFGALPIPDGISGGKDNRGQQTSNYRPLLIEHEMLSLPSASTLAILRKELVGRRRGAKTVAVLADPVFQVDDPRVSRDSARTDTGNDTPPSNSVETRKLESEMERSARDTGEIEFRRLPFSRQEAEGIAALTSNAMRKESLDFEANLVTATGADLSNYRIIHFATHGLLDSKHPELSGIVLSLVDKDGKPQDGFLRLHEIYNLKLGADLVVLSACRTALGKEIKGEGLVGLTRGFMYAGAPRVVASLWAVDDEITAELMKRFYHAMLIKRQRPAAALRSAQAGIWKDKRLPPYYWAAFVLQGEWK